MPQFKGYVPFSLTNAPNSNLNLNNFRWLTEIVNLTCLVFQDVISIWKQKGTQ